MCCAPRPLLWEEKKTKLWAGVDGGAAAPQNRDSVGNDRRDMQGGKLLPCLLSQNPPLVLWDVMVLPKFLNLLLI